MVVVSHSISTLKVNTWQRRENDTPVKAAAQAAAGKTLRFLKDETCILTNTSLAPALEDITDGSFTLYLY